jgi:F-box protein 21
MAAAAASMSLFPHEFSDELLLDIFSHVPPEDNLRSIQLVCKRFAKVADDQTIWRRHCCTSFQYWRREHRFHEKIEKKAALDYDWKRLWLLRKRINAHIEATFNIVLRTKVGRLRGIRHICCYGYDAKDFLLEQSRTADDVEDVLARR